MNKIEKLLREHNEEFMEMVNEFYDERYTSKKGKTICYFKAGGKYYNNNKFVDNYINFLTNLTQIIGKNVFKQKLKTSVKFDPSEFSPSVRQKGQYENINDVFYISTYSGTDKKIKHITDLCEYLDMPLQLEYQSNTIRELEMVE
jgi:hypothetical protein